MNLPNKSEALELLKANVSRETKINHGLRVSKIAKVLAIKLKEKGVPINVNLTATAALLHDIGDKHRLHDWRKDKHVEQGAEIVKACGYPEMAGIIQKHDVMSFTKPDTTPKTWEEKIVNYSDKRDLHKSGLCSLDERKAQYLLNFPEFEDIINMAFQRIKSIENEIFERININPQDLKEMLKTAD